MYVFDLSIWWNAQRNNGAREQCDVVERVAGIWWMESSGLNHVAGTEWFESGGLNRVAGTEWLESGSMNRIVRTEWSEPNGWNRVAWTEWPESMEPNKQPELNSRNQVIKPSDGNRMAREAELSI